MLEDYLSGLLVGQISDTRCACRSSISGVGVVNLAQIEVVSLARGTEFTPETSPKSECEFTPN